MKNCGKASFQPDGSVVYQPGDNPPPDLAGSDRDPLNPYRFIPIWDDCSHRLNMARAKPCGALQVFMYCKCPEAPQCGKLLKLDDCEDCPLRK